MQGWHGRTAAVAPQPLRCWASWESPVCTKTAKEKHHTTTQSCHVCANCTDRGVGHLHFWFWSAAQKHLTSSTADQSVAAPNGTGLHHASMLVTVRPHQRPSPPNESKETLLTSRHCTLQHYNESRQTCITLQAQHCKHAGIQRMPAGNLQVCALQQHAPLGAHKHAPATNTTPENAW